MTFARHVIVEATGGTSALQIVNRHIAPVGPLDVLIHVKANGLNRADVLQRQGHYPAPPDAPSDVLGLEFAGIVAEVGASVSGWQLGQRVMGIVSGGAMAEQIVVPAALLLPVPPALGWEAAAAVPEAFITAWDAIEQLEIRQGQTCLVTAAASGVGLAFVQLAVQLGATVLGTTRSSGKRAIIERFGASVCPSDQPLADWISHRTNGEGVSAVMDLVGGNLLPDLLSVLRPRGKILLVGLLAGARCTLPLGALMAKRAWLGGTVLRSRTLAERAALTQSFANQVLAKLSDGSLMPVVAQTMPIEEIRQAHALMEANAWAGKCVLTW